VVAAFPMAEVALGVLAVKGRAESVQEAPRAAAAPVAQVPRPAMVVVAEMLALRAIREMAKTTQAAEVLLATRSAKTGAPSL
jgi:hypothetical protein